jgi:hypothetical protein
MVRFCPIVLTPTDRSAAATYSPRLILTQRTQLLMTYCLPSITPLSRLHFSVGEKRMPSLSRRLWSLFSLSLEVFPLHHPPNRPVR